MNDSHPRDVGKHQTTLRAAETFGLGELDILHPSGSFALTPASLIAVEAIGRNQQLLSGIGIDWGCGSGCMAIAAAKIAAVEHVIGLDIVDANVTVARENAQRNGVDRKTTFLQSDSYAPALAGEATWLDSFARRADFILSNPPASDGDDGFEFRRIVLRDGRRFLKPGGVVFLNVSFQYGPQRVERLVCDAPGYLYRGVIASTGWVPFDLTREDLLQNVHDYVREEERGGLEYAFRGPLTDTSETVNARRALAVFQQTRLSPLSKWQTHLFVFNA